MATTPCNKKNKKSIAINNVLLFLLYFWVKQVCSYHILYICDNGTGLRVLNVKDPANPVELTVLTEDSYIDVIPSGDLLIGMLNDGIAYLDISDPTSPQKLAHIKK